MQYSIAEQALKLASDPLLSADCDDKPKEVSIWFTSKKGEIIAYRSIACCASSAHLRAYFELMPEVMQRMEISSIGVKFLSIVKE